MQSPKRKRKQESSPLQRTRIDPGVNMDIMLEKIVKISGITMITGVGNFEYR